MKKLLSLAVAVALAATLTPALTNAQISRSAPLFNTVPVTWQHIRSVGGQISVIDSSYALIRGNYANLSKADTSGAINLTDAYYKWAGSMLWNLPGSVADTVHAFTVTLLGNDGAALAGCDTLRLKYQTSEDGFTWTAVDTIGANSETRTDFTTNASAAISLFTTKGGIGTDRINWFRANFLRLILDHDPNTAAGTRITAAVRFYTTYPK